MNKSQHAELRKIIAESNDELLIKDLFLASRTRLIELQSQRKVPQTDEQISQSLYVAPFEVTSIRMNRMLIKEATGKSF